MQKRKLSLALIVALAPAALAQDVTFRKSKYSSVKQPKEVAVDLAVTDSNIVIKGRKGGAVDREIPFTSIDAMSYELAKRHRVAEGAAVMLFSLGAGAVVMVTKTKSHWLVIEHHQDADKEMTVLHLDKSEYKSVIAALEFRTGKPVAVLDSKTSQLNPTAGSRDMEEVVPFGSDQVAAALKPAMENMGCNPTDVTATRIECKRGRGGSERTGSGGEKVTATLEPMGDQTRVRIWTGKGFSGRGGKKNWSMPIYQEMLKGLGKPEPAAAH